MEKEPLTSRGPPARPRKRKAPTLRAEAWEPYKTRIIELHITEDRPLPEVKRIIEEEFPFVAGLRQYRTRISQWGKDKNVKPEEMRAIVRKRQRRKLIEVEKRKLVSEVRGQAVESPKIDRWMKRNELRESSLCAPNPAASTPSAVHCRTISEVVDSPAPSLRYSPLVANLQAMSPAALTTVPFSPALSIASIVRPQESAFHGNSPAPYYRTLPSSFGSPISGFQAGANITMNPSPLRYKQAEEEDLRKRLSYAEYGFGFSHRKTLDILFQLGIMLVDQGRYGSAETVVRRVVEGYQTAAGVQDVRTLNAFDLLGDILQRQGFFTKAEKLHRRAWMVKRDKLGAAHPETLGSISCLAEDYMFQGRWKEAEHLAVEVLETRKRILGEEHVNTRRDTATWAEIYRVQGRLKEAEQLLMRELGNCQRAYGEEHHETLRRKSQLALIHRGRGRLEVAEQMELQVLETAQRVLGGEHPATLIFMHDLSVSLKLQGKIGEAISLMEDCVQLKKRVLGHQHPATQASAKFLQNLKADHQ